MLCAGVKGTKLGGCYGDSGGPSYAGTVLVDLGYFTVQLVGAQDPVTQQ